MKKRFLFPIFAALISLTACDFTIFSVEDNTEGEGEKEVPVEVDPTVIDNYYKDYDLTKTGGRLAVELQKLTFEKHKVYVKYGQINSYYSTTTNRNSTEAISDGSKTNEWYYTGKRKAGTSGSNREHVWPCANSGGLWTHDESAGTTGPHYVDNSNYVGGGSDLYHVRLCEAKVNTARGNSRFVSFDDPEWSMYKNSVKDFGENEGLYNIKLYNYETTASGGIQFAKQTEVDDHMKGDVARLVLYVWMHYTERGVTPTGGYKSGTTTYNFSDMTGALSLSMVMGYDSEERCLEVLKSWNKLDAPSNVEKLRNETVQKIQGNRNPFVDYPELVDQL